MTNIDNGKGFNVEKTEYGNGLHNMQKRAEDIEAVLNVNSKENNGTQIHLTI